MKHTLRLGFIAKAYVKSMFQQSGYESLRRFTKASKRLGWRTLLVQGESSAFKVET
jgi:hypothetical protein